MSTDMEETAEAVTRLIDKMRPQDRLAIIAFDESVFTLKELGPVINAEALKNTVRALPADGAGFNIDSATEAAFEMLSGSSERLERVMVLSCGYPSISENDRFSTAVKAGTARGIGTSFFGVLLGYSSDVSDLLGQTPGGASYYLAGLERVVEAFDTDFESMVTPLAYEMRIGFDSSEAYRIDKLYGIPGDSEGEANAEANIATAFLSNRRGGIVARVSALESPATSDSVATLSLDYIPEPAIGFSDAVSETATMTSPTDDSTEYFDSIGVRIAAALVNQGEQMRNACASYHQDEAAEAITMLNELADHLEHEAAELNHDGLRDEAILVRKLSDNMQ